MENNSNDNKVDPFIYYKYNNDLTSEKNQYSNNNDQIAQDKTTYGNNFVPPATSAPYAGTDQQYAQPQIYPNQNVCGNPMPTTTATAYTGAGYAQTWNYNKSIEKLKNKTTIAVNYEFSIVKVNRVDYELVENYNFNRLSTKDVKNITTTPICNCSIYVKQITYSHDKSIIEKLSLKLCFDSNVEKYVETTLSALQRYDNNLLKALLSKGTQIKEKSDFKLICDMIVRQSNNTPSLIIASQKGYYLSKGCLRYGSDSQERDIIGNACEASEFLSLLNVKPKEGYINRTGCYMLLFAMLASIGRLKSLFENPLPVPVIIDPDFSEAVRQIGNILETNIVEIHNAKDFNNIIQNENSYNLFVPITIAREVSNYKKNQIYALLSKANCISSEDNPTQGLIGLVEKSADAISKQPYKNDFFIIPHIPFDNANVNKIACWFQMEALKYYENFVKKINYDTKKFASKIQGSDVLPESHISLMAFCISLLDYIMQKAGIDKRVSYNIESHFYNYLHTLMKGDFFAAEQFLNIIKNYDKDKFIYRLSNEAIPNYKLNDTLFVDNDYICLTTENMNKIADFCGTTSNNLCRLLSEKNYLHKQNGYQANIRISPINKEIYIHAIRQDKLFRFGELRLFGNEYAINKPFKQIYLGKSTNGERVYFTINLGEGKTNSHCFVTGVSRSGKTTFLSNFARSLAQNNMEVLIIDPEGEYKELNPSAKIYEIGDGEYTFLTAVSAEDMADDVKQIIKPVKFLPSYSDLMKQITDCETAYEYLEKFAEILCERGITNNVYEAVTNMLDSPMYRGKPLSFNELLESGSISVIDISDCTYKKTAAEYLFAKLLKYKSSKENVTPCVVIADEFRMYIDGEKSSLYDLLNRGGKRGIYVALALQELTSQDPKHMTAAINQCQSKFYFQQPDPNKILKNEGWRETEGAYQTLKDLQVGECVAFGHFGTEISSIGYPVKIITPLEIQLGSSEKN